MTTTRISKPQVMESAAGFYIGTSELTIQDFRIVDEQPYERLSGYYPNRQLAEQDIKEYN